MNVMSYATSESYQNGVELKRSEFETTPRVEGASRLLLARPIDTVNAVVWTELSAA